MCNRVRATPAPHSHTVASPSSSRLSACCDSAASAAIRMSAVKGFRCCSAGAYLKIYKYQRAHFCFVSIVYQQKSWHQRRAVPPTTNLVKKKMSSRNPPQILELRPLPTAPEKEVVARAVGVFLSSARKLAVPMV